MTDGRDDHVLTARATGYFRQLSDLLASTRVTDGNGNEMTLDDGGLEAVDIIKKSGANDGKTVIVGNGGSAAVASHMQNDIFKAAGIRSLVFTEQPLLTALTNDNGYDSAYESAARMWVEPRDVLLAISSSGGSENILRAARVALDVGAPVLTFSGFSPTNALRSMGAVNFHVASHSYGLVETAHAAIGHFITDAVAGLLNHEGEY